MTPAHTNPERNKNTKEEWDKTNEKEKKETHKHAHKHTSKQTNTHSCTSRAHQPDEHACSKRGRYLRLGSSHQRSNRVIEAVVTGPGQLEIDLPVGLAMN